MCFIGGQAARNRPACSEFAVSIPMTDFISLHDDMYNIWIPAICAALFEALLSFLISTGTYTINPKESFIIGEKRYRTTELKFVQQIYSKI